MPAFRAEGRAAPRRQRLARLSELVPAALPPCTRASTWSAHEAHPASLLSVAVKTGPEIGTRIPDFAAADQNCRQQTFTTLRGPKGLVLMFVRSADW